MTAGVGTDDTQRSNGPRGRAGSGLSDSPCLEYMQGRLAGSVVGACL